MEATKFVGTAPESCGKLMENLVSTFTELEKTITQHQVVIAELEALPLCTGKVYWRQRENGRSLYANHSTNTSCPMCGEPKKGGRIRKYIGEDTYEQDKVTRAMERWGKLEESRAKMSEAQKLLNNLMRRVNSAICNHGWVF